MEFAKPTLLLVVAAAGACSNPGSVGEFTAGADASGATGASAAGADTTGGGESSAGMTSAGDTMATVTSTTSTADDTTDAVLFDLGVVPDAGVTVGPGWEFSNIWIANTHQGTLSKIDTETMTELGRYVTRPDGAGSPSRTSVNLDGDVAVLNRSGGVAKFFAEEVDCQDTNGTPGVQTAIGANFLAWGEEECLAWYTPMQYSSQRAVAWTSTGDLWVTGYNQNSPEVDVHLLDGSTGVVIDSTSVPVTPWTGFWTTKQAYGGAVDGNDDFWWTSAGATDGPEEVLVRVRHSDLTHDVFEKEFTTYGMTVDSVGRPWACGTGRMGRFDPVAEAWDWVEWNAMAPADAPANSTGCMADKQGRLWFAVGLENSVDLNGIASLDTDTLMPLEIFPLPNDGEFEFPRGISIDVNGYVWGVGYRFQAFDPGGNRAYRLDPDTGTFSTFAGLSGAYTYSDMTGAGLLGVQPEG
jgi:hypothetical protein